MSNLQIIQVFSEIIEQQNAIIRAQTESLHQLGAVCMEEETEHINAMYSHFLGEGDAPDFLAEP